MEIYNEVSISIHLDLDEIKEKLLKTKIQKFEIYIGLRQILCSESINIINIH